MNNDIENVPSNSTTSNGTGEKLIPFCRQVLTQQLGDANVRIWDVAIILPNAIFFIFLLYKFRRILQKLRDTRSPVFRAFFVLVYAITVLSIVRCSVSMCASASNTASVYVVKALWLLLKFALLSAELLFWTFALLFGHLESSKSIRRALIATFVVSAIFSCIQTILEFTNPDSHFHGNGTTMDVYSHGGMGFLLITSILCTLLYVLPFAVPYTPLLRRVFLAPERRRFYVYCALLTALNALQAIGAALVVGDMLAGMCIVAITSYLYVTIYTPIVYFTFLKNYVPNAAAARKPQGLGSLGEGDESSNRVDYYRRFSGINTPTDEDVDNPYSWMVDDGSMNSSSFGHHQSMDATTPINDELSCAVQSDASSGGVVGVHTPRLELLQHT